MDKLLLILLSFVAIVAYIAWNVRKGRKADIESLPTEDLPKVIDVTRSKPYSDAMRGTKKEYGIYLLVRGIKRRSRIKNKL